MDHRGRRIVSGVDSISMNAGSAKTPDTMSPPDSICPFARQQVFNQKISKKFRRLRRINFFDFLAIPLGRPLGSFNFFSGPFGRLTLFPLGAFCAHAGNSQTLEITTPPRHSYPPDTNCPLLMFHTGLSFVVASLLLAGLSPKCNGFTRDLRPH